MTVGGTVSAFPAGQFYLVRLKDGGFLALHRECTHLGCTVPWVAERARFACPSGWSSSLSGNPAKRRRPRQSPCESVRSARVG